jgi:hypothetical protein
MNDEMTCHRDLMRSCLGAVRSAVGQVSAYFEPQVLAPYREQAERYSIKTDLFSGRVTVTADYYQSEPENIRRDEYIDVRFGYRTARNGDLRIAAFLPDLVDRSPAHVDRWRPFLAQNVDWVDYDSDERFVLWVTRYIEGRRWGGQSPVQSLVEELELINALTTESVGPPLYDVHEPEVVFPCCAE